MMKVVLKVEIHDQKIKKKAMKAVSGISGVETVSVDMKDLKMTIIGDVDAVKVVDKLRKFCHAEMLSVGPAKEDKKKEPNKEKPEEKKDPKAELLKVYKAYCNQTRQQQYPYYYYRTVEEDPTGCVIC